MKNYTSCSELLADYQSPVEILGESGLLKQLTKRLVERALSGELSHHLSSEKAENTASRNSRNGSSAKTVQSEHGELEVIKTKAVFPDEADEHTLPA
ncbi:MAG: hypothetical protein F6J97_18180 [Leptolyngbya sp. SIO4C1]|nr:hypothetical protein [Leptolyngbya sp. SIO4C1]